MQHSCLLLCSLLRLKSFVLECTMLVVTCCAFPLALVVGLVGTADIILLSECVFFFKEISAALILHFLAYYVLCLVKLMIDDLT